LSADAVFGFAFIVMLPIVAVAGAVVTLFAIGALFDTLDNPGDVRRRIEGIFRQPPAAPKAPPADHYYKPYWQQP
jgi:hypothetical protein